MRYAILIILLVLVLAYLKYYLGLKKKYEEENGIKPVEPVRKIKREETMPDESLNIESEKIILRHFIPQEEKPLSVILSNKDVATPLGIEPIKKISQMKVLFDEYLDSITTYAVLMKSTNRLIGILQYEPDGEAVKLKFGINRQSWNCGIGTGVLELIEEYLGKEGYSKIIADVKIDDNNKKFLEHHGFSLKDKVYEKELKDS